MKRAFIAIALAAGLSAGPAVSAWDPAGLTRVQAQKGRQTPPPERADRGRDARQERPDERRGRMTEDERRSLQRDLDKANREIYGGRPQK
jgi:hypothetical protein